MILCKSNAKTSMASVMMSESTLRLSIFIDYNKSVMMYESLLRLYIIDYY